MNDIVERLYDRGVCSPAQNSCRNDYICEEVAYEITRLRAKVAKADALARLDASLFTNAEHQQAKDTLRAALQQPTEPHRATHSAKSVPRRG